MAGSGLLQCSGCFSRTTGENTSGTAMDAATASATGNVARLLHSASNVRLSNENGRRWVRLVALIHTAGRPGVPMLANVAPWKTSASSQLREAVAGQAQQAHRVAHLLEPSSL